MRRGILQVMAGAMSQQPGVWPPALCIGAVSASGGGNRAGRDPAAAEAHVPCWRRCTRFLPNSVIALAAPGGGNRRANPCWRPGHGGRQPHGYVCRNYVCNLPVTQPADLAPARRVGTNRTLMDADVPTFGWP